MKRIVLVFGMSDDMDKVSMEAGISRTGKLRMNALYEELLKQYGNFGTPCVFGDGRTASEHNAHYLAVLMGHDNIRGQRVWNYNSAYDLFHDKIRICKQPDTIFVCGMTTSHLLKDVIDTWNLFAPAFNCQVVEYREWPMEPSPTAIILEPGRSPKHLPRPQIHEPFVSPAIKIPHRA